MNIEKCRPKVVNQIASDYAELSRYKIEDLNKQKLWINLITRWFPSNCLVEHRTPPPLYFEIN